MEGRLWDIVSTAVPNSRTETPSVVHNTLGRTTGEARERKVRLRQTPEGRVQIKAAARYHRKRMMDDP